MENAWKSKATQLAFALTKRIASILIPLGFGFGDFSTAAKAAFVAAAEAQIRNRGKRPSTAKISILTGLTRAEVARIRAGKQQPTKSTSEQRTERVMHGWFTDPHYVDDRGAPRSLPMKGPESFEELVRRYGADVPRKAVLEELISGGMATLDSAELVSALRRHHVAPTKDHVDLDRLSTDLETIFLSSEATVAGATPLLRRITVQFGGPIAASVKRTVNVRTERFLEALSDYLHSEASASTQTANASQPGPAFSILVSQSESHEKK